MSPGRKKPERVALTVAQSDEWTRRSSAYCHDPPCYVVIATCLTVDTSEILLTSDRRRKSNPKVATHSASSLRQVQCLADR
jgi:hypothetical protein